MAMSVLIIVLWEKKLIGHACNLVQGMSVPTWIRSQFSMSLLPRIKQY